MNDRDAQIICHRRTDDDVAKLAWPASVVVAVDREREHVGSSFNLAVGEVQLSDPLFVDELNGDVAIFDSCRSERESEQTFDLGLWRVASRKVNADVVKLDHRLPSSSLTAFALGAKLRGRTFGESTVRLNDALHEAVTDDVIGAEADEIDSLNLA